MAVRWHDYQIEAAELFADLGFAARVDATVEGARARHAVDVLVTGQLASIEVMWVIECKCWRSRVGKAQVATLVEVVRDVGADRGVLLSEEGFQPGAHDLATRQNITLSDLKTLRATTEAEVLSSKLSVHRRALLRVGQRMTALTVTK